MTSSLYNNERNADFAVGRKVYQFCDDCGTERIHYVLKNKITCFACGRFYEVKERAVEKKTIMVTKLTVRNTFFLL